MKNRLCFRTLLFALMLHSVFASSQQLTIQNEAGNKTVLSRADSEALPREKVTTAAAGSTATFEGIMLRDVLEKAGVSLGESVRGKRIASYLLVEAADGYRVVFALPEINPGFTTKKFVLPLKREDRPPA